MASPCAFYREDILVLGSKYNCHVCTHCVRVDERPLLMLKAVVFILLTAVGNDMWIL